MTFSYILKWSYSIKTAGLIVGFCWNLGPVGCGSDQACSEWDRDLGTLLCSLSHSWADFVVCNNI